MLKVGALKVQKIGIVARKDLKKALATLRDLLLYLKNKGLEVLVDEEVAMIHKDPEVRKAAVGIGDLKTADVIITIGGDGTILRTIRRLGAPIKILGIDMGSMGFLCEVEPEEMYYALDKVLAGQYHVQRVNLLAVGINGVQKDLALNDILIYTPQPAKVLDLQCKVDGITFFDGRADGLLISTPIGSTAYVVSLGGPLIDPTLNCLTAIVLNPLKLGVRPFVFSASSIIEVSFPTRKRKAAVIYSDGALTSTVSSKSIVEIRVSDLYVDFLRIRDLRHMFYKKFYEVRIRGGKEG